jgi:hypothetical protein
MGNLLVGQESYFVFQKSGTPILNTEFSVKRGEIFGRLDTLVIKKSDTVFLINAMGEVFELNSPASYTYGSINNYKKKSDRKSLTIGYFTYVWKQFSNQKESRQRAGVVYREERKITLTKPMDSIQWYVPEIEFSWINNTNSEIVFFHLQQENSEHITKIGTSSNSLILYRDNVILRNGMQYKWAVTKEAFPNFGTIGFKSFKLLTKAQYTEFKAKMKALSKGLELLGFSEKDIRNAICLDYKFCEE